MTKEELREALECPTKANRKALAKYCLALESEEPERYGQLLSKEDRNGESALAFKAYQRARMLSRITMGLAVILVIAAYMVGDFGLRIFTGWLNRYALAIAVCLAMGLFAGVALLVNTRKERLIAYALLEESGIGEEAEI